MKLPGVVQTKPLASGGGGKQPPQLPPLGTLCQREPLLQGHVWDKGEGKVPRRWLVGSNKLKVMDEWARSHEYFSVSLCCLLLFVAVVLLLLLL